ncbi:MAG: MipA/OmpV family protein [Desulfobacterales bacterium]|nr:MipA/OmpV family protein [Desulfobacterales bacterium]
MSVMITGMMILFAGGVFAHAVDLPVGIERQVSDAYPGAEIEAVRYEQWQGQMVYEVEIETRDGKELELIFSKDGELLEVEEEAGLPWIGGELSIGAGLMAETEIYRGTDTEFQPAFFFRYENNRLALQAYQDLALTYSFYRTDRLDLAVKGAVDFGGGYDPEDSSYLTGMDELDTVYTAGLTGAFRIGEWDLGLEVLQDVSGEHDGQEVEVSVARTWMIGAFEFTPAVNLTWMSGDATDYYYGVSTREARADRAAYSPGAGFEAEVELMVQRPIYGDFTAIGVAGITAFGSEITNSPIVDEDYAGELVLGVMYSF